MHIDAVEISKKEEEATPNDPSEASGAGISWDEPTIAEHDKERGTRTKITEPKTPYNPDNASSASASDDEATSSLSHSMDVDSGDESHHGSKHSPRFALPPSHKKHKNAGEDESDDVSMANSHPDDSLEPHKRKVRAAAEPIAASGLDVQMLEKKMAEVKEQRKSEEATQRRKTARPEDHSSEEDDEEEEDEHLTPQERAKKAAFAQKRKQHYDEFRRIKELLAKQDDDDSDSEDSSDS